jgi:hypothetical protein
MKHSFQLIVLVALALMAQLSGRNAAVAQTNGAGSTPAPAVWARVTLLEPRDVQWRMQIIAHNPPHGAPSTLFAGQKAGAKAEDAPLMAANAASPWIALSPILQAGVPSVRFLFETSPALDKRGVQARFDIATAPDDKAIVRSITEHDPGNVISIRIPTDLVKDKKWLLSIREDTQRRLDEIKALKLPDGPLPKQIWTMTGFRSNGQFYTDPKIAEMDFDIIKALGMNGFWEQNGGQPGALRAMAKARGINRSTVYWRAVESPPRDNELGAVRLDWNALDKFIDEVYHRAATQTFKAYPEGMPTLIADLMDEPAGQGFDGPEWRAAFHDYAQRQGLAPEFFGQKSWDEVVPPRMGWGSFFKQRAALDLNDLNTRRLFYWTLKFWNYCNARMYALATRKVEQYAPGVGTRVNFGPPWFYDYGTLPRGIDAFEMGRLRGVSLGFNEDWTGSGSPRLPLEVNTLLMDWSRAAARPAQPMLGSYITRDADRETVKLRVFGALARECKIFDFYYYGPAYTFFDHWSDNFSMVQGVGEVTRDLGQVDDILAAGHAPQAQVALLYSKSWPVWKTSDTEQNEQIMTYLALLHAGVPVDFVSDEQIADGSFAAKRYKALYVVNESIPTAAATEIARWVRNGGRLWTSGWGGMRDEYNTPTPIWNAMLGVTERSWKPTGDLARLGEVLQPADWQRPIFGREVSLQMADDAGAAFLSPAGAHAARAYQRTYGKGLVQVVPWAAGKEYSDAAKEQKSTLTKSVIFPGDEKRTIFTDFALTSGIEPPATTSVSQILAWPLWTQQQGVVLLANFTGEPAQNLTVKFTAPVLVKSIRSLKQGALKFTQPDPQHVELTLPMPDVTDILVVE